MGADRRIGILGGTFDPIHCGHLAIARAALKCLRLDQVVFIPAGHPWIKTGSRRKITDAAHRLAMVELAVADVPDFTVSAIEIDRPGPTYTVDTLLELRRQAEAEMELYLILGMDSIHELSRWRGPERIFQLAIMVAVSRPHVDDIQAAEIERRFPGAAGRVTVIRGPQMDTSATDIRDRLADGRSVVGHAPADVISYIQEHELYQRDSA